MGGTAEAFVKAHEYFKANKDNEPEDERPAPMTAAKWRQIFDEQYEGDDGDDIEDEFPEDIDEEMGQVLESIKEKMAPEDDLAQEMTQGLEMKFNKIAPLGKEDTAEELQERRMKTVYQL